MNATGYIKKLFVFFAGTVLLLTACSKGTNPQGSSPIPNVTVNLSININKSPYTALTTIGGVVNLTGTGVGNRGIMLFRLNANTITAFDRMCSYDISNNNGIVGAQSNGTGLCIDCGSTYNLANGGVNTGPSTIGLKQYNTSSFNATTGALTITN
jgi:hypothetical protein